jgi:hypothetical protein
MAAIVRIFGISGLLTAEVQSNRGHTDSVQLIKYPVLGRDLLNCTTTSSDVSELSASPSGANLAMVQVQAGKTVHFEVIPTSYPLVEADETSPTMSGQQMLQWGPGWRISVREAS